jgi:putative ABC transport system substrate-binding protein
MSGTGGSSIYRAFFAELRRLGYVEDRNLIVDRRSAEGRVDSFEQFAKDLAQLNSDAIFATSSRLIRELKKYTKTTPIVGFMADPIAFGLVESLARPGGNITGITADAGISASTKRLELLKEVIPTVSRVAYLTSRRLWEREAHEAPLLMEAAQRLGVTLVGAPIDSPIVELAYRRAFDQMVEANVDAFEVGDTPENNSNRSTIITLAKENKLPAIYADIEALELGGLITYGIDFKEVFRRAADYIDEILKGVKPSELPIYQPTKFRLGINMKTARALGLQLPDTFLARADEVIE